MLFRLGYAGGAWCGYEVQDFSDRSGCLSAYASGCGKAGVSKETGTVAGTGKNRSCSHRTDGRTDALGISVSEKPDAQTESICFRNQTAVSENAGG